MMNLYFTPKRLTDMWKDCGDGCIEASGHFGIIKFNRAVSALWPHLDGLTTIKQLILVIESISEYEQQNIERLVCDSLLYLKQRNCIILNYMPLHPFAEFDENTEYIYKLDNESPLDVLLLFPPSPSFISLLHHTGTINPQGIASIAASVKNETNYSIDFLNLWLSNCNEKSLRSLLITCRPKVIGLSCMTENFLNGIRIAKIIKKIHACSIFYPSPLPFCRQKQCQSQ